MTRPVKQQVKNRVLVEADRQVEWQVQWPFLVSITEQFNDPSTLP